MLVEALAIFVGQVQVLLDILRVNTTVVLLYVFLQPCMIAVELENRS